MDMTGSVPPAFRARGATTGGINAGGMTWRLSDVMTGRMARGRTGAQRGRERPSGIGRQGTCRAWEGGRSRPRCVVAPVADDGRGLGRHKPPPVRVRCKFHRRGGLQTPAPRYECHTPIARPRDAVLARGEHSAEPAFPSAFPLFNPSGGADQGGEMLVGMRQDMAVHLSRPPRQGISGHGRRCGV